MVCPTLNRSARRADRRAPCSTSSSRSPEALPDPEASKTSSSLSSRYGSYLGFEGDPRARERTTSPLQMGQVRRLVVSHGVLRYYLISNGFIFEGAENQLTCNRHGTRGHTASSSRGSHHRYTPPDKQRTRSVCPCTSSTRSKYDGP